jgi:hypothetical protein
MSVGIETAVRYTVSIYVSMRQDIELIVTKCEQCHVPFDVRWV